MSQLFIDMILNRDFFPSVFESIHHISNSFMAICYYCKNQNRNNIWTESSSLYYSQNRVYGQPTNISYYHQQPTNRFNEKF